MKSSFSLSLDSKRAEWLEDEARRLNLSRSQIIRDLLDAGMRYLNKRDSVGYIEIDFLEASDEDILSLVRRCANVLRERKKMDNISTNIKSQRQSSASLEAAQT
jgi:hypothetical protein